MRFWACSINSPSWLGTTACFDWIYRNKMVSCSLNSPRLEEIRKAGRRLELWVYAWRIDHRKANVSRQLYTQSDRKSNNLDWSSKHSRFEIFEDRFRKINAGYTYKNKTKEQKRVVSFNRSWCNWLDFKDTEFQSWEKADYVIGVKTSLYEVVLQ